MKHRVFFLVVALWSTALFWMCAAKRPVWGDIERGLILQYQLKENQNLVYQRQTSVDQSMEVMGQEMKFTFEMGQVFNVNCMGYENGRYQLDVRVDSIQAVINSIQGMMKPDMGSILGAHFTMSLSPLGKEKDFKGLEKMIYLVGPGDERNLDADFQTLFPDAAGKPIKRGDTWTSLDTLTIASANSEMIFYFTTASTFIGLETIAGHECAKIESKSIGKLTGTAQQNMADIEFDGESQGTEVWYFDYKKGVFVKAVSDLVTDADINVVSPQEMTIPMTMHTKGELKLKSAS
ncbi:MAG: hypothetical protein EHM72_03250 [Calditrichaeota bacterium]|nr:MAG: hypothetical protein EHM72_03250 [Calditrichota bacterium]